jgi:hypothetical protein
MELKLQRLPTVGFCAGRGYANANARWNSESDLEAMQQTPEFRASLGTLKGEIVSAEPHSFEVMYTVGEP